MVSWVQKWWFFQIEEQYSQNLRFGVLSKMDLVVVKASYLQFLYLYCTSINKKSRTS